MGELSEESLSPLLAAHTDEEIRKDKAAAISFREIGRSSYRNLLPISILLCLLYVVVGLTFVILNSGQCKHPKQETSRLSILRDVLQFEERKEWVPPQYPWNQPPSTVLDSAWEDLLYALNIRVSGDEMSKLELNVTNRVQVDHGDYFAALGVFHYLHCLNNLRKVVHWDHYGPQIMSSGNEEAFGKEHSDHCISVLRQALMCHANVQVNTAEWVDENNFLGGKELRLDPTTNCVKWDTLDGWARARALKSGKFSFRPGPFYRAGTGDK
ncbi:uncharacterized protein F4822DRAFT_383572 [Hypoxylon trugodes]|uniref:uncharacterized protein n=1 Tax=Hypoxylon trugodes TaxID=326681 RepID=UPI00219323BE|nr:uncharacterized protein F4822DRAFT_383572 [Hypoxylon trugodes]KAI1393103.1 hypothetical protein F4822DRAFT_383572 [Hypoxylon trugodes]